METQPTLYDITLLPQPSPPTHEDIVEILRTSLGIESFTARLAVKHRPYILLRGLSLHDAARIQDKLLRRGLALSCTPPLPSDSEKDPQTAQHTTKKVEPSPALPKATKRSSDKEKQADLTSSSQTNPASSRPTPSSSANKVLRAPHPSTAHAYLHPPFLKRQNHLAHTFHPSQGLFHAFFTSLRLPFLGSGLLWHLFLGTIIATTLVFLALLRPILYIFILIHPLLVTIALSLAAQFFLNCLHTTLLDEPAPGPIPSLLALEIWLSGAVLYFWCLSLLFPLFLWVQFIDPLLPKGWISHLPIFALASLPLLLWPLAITSLTSGSLASLWNIRSYTPLIRKFWPYYIPLLGVGLLTLFASFPLLLHIYLGGPDIVYWSTETVLIKTALSSFVGFLVAYSQGFMGAYLGSIALIDPTILPKPRISPNEDLEGAETKIISSTRADAPWPAKASAAWPSEEEAMPSPLPEIPEDPATLPPSTPTVPPTDPL